MKQILLTFIALMLLYTSPAVAVEVGDFYYSNHTVNKELVQGLYPIGIVYLVNDNKTSGLILSLEQPGSKNWQRAQTYCHLYQAKGTEAGDWFMPDFLQIFPINRMQNRRLDHKTFLHVNDQLNLIKEAAPLKAEIYITASDYANARDSAIGINLTTGDLQKLKKKSRHNFRCMMSF